MSISLIAASEQILATNVAVINTRPITVSAWCLTKGFTGNWQKIFAVDNDTPAGNGYALYIGSSGGAYWTCGDGDWANANSPKSINLNTWYHFVGIEYATNNRAVFVNGGNKGTNTTTQGDPVVDMTGIGGGMGASDFDTHFNGYIAETCVWNDVLSAYEVAALYNGIHPKRIRPNKIKLWMPLDSYNFRDEISGLQFTAYNGPIIGPGPPINRPARRIAKGLSITFQYARPDGDISAGNWQPSTGSDLYAMIDEETPSDSDYVFSGNNPSGDLFEVSLTNVSDPGSSSNHKISYRIKKVGDDTLNLTFYLMEGATQRATWSENDISETITESSYTLTSGEADSITDYSNLRIRVSASVV